MFNINIDLHKSTLSKLQELEQTMIDERESQLDCIEQMSRGWFGVTADTFISMQTNMLENGLYEKTIQQVKGMGATMEEALERLIKLKNRCNSFHMCLSGSSMLTCGYASGNVMCKSSAIAKIGTSCENIHNNNVNIKQGLDDVMDACGGIVNFGDCKTRVKSAYNKIENMQILNNAIQTYARDVQDLDTYLQIAYSGYVDEESLEKIKDLEKTELQNKLEALKEELSDKGFTLEQYRSSILDTLMYLDFFDEAGDYYPDNVDMSNIKTINDLIDALGKYDLYTNPENEAESTRYIYFEILKDAVKKDPVLGEFQIQSMSRNMKGKNYNKGTNGITFVDPSNGTVYVAFRGTSAGEWGDDGRRFSVKDFDSMTPQMVQTLDYFETVAKDMNWNDDMRIIVTGHSQGGNDSQVVTLFSDYGHYVDQCFSFDGEGHSPDLLENAKKAMNKKYGDGEYQNRIKKMYSICGEYDFVNHLGQKAIPEENTIYVHCGIKGADVARMHDIVSMFCDDTDGKYTYSGTINTSKGTSPSVVTDLTANLWDKIAMMPDDMRYSCQEAIMNIAEMALTGEKEGLNGEKASVVDYIIFANHGLNAIISSGKKTVRDTMGDLTEEYVVSNICDMAVKNGFIYEEQSKYVESMMNNAIDQITDLQDTVDTVMDLNNMYGGRTLGGTAIKNLITAASGNYKETYTYLIGEQVFDFASRSVERIKDNGKSAGKFIQKGVECTIDDIKTIGDYIKKVGKYIINM